METLKNMIDQEHEQVVFCYDKSSGLKAIIAIHNTILGPALGGLRLWPYACEKDALFDVLRLSRGMTYKNAAAGLNLGGGKAVILGDPSIKSEALYRAFGRNVQSLGGRYVTAEDVNTSTEDIMQIREETNYVTGLPETAGGGGNPSPITAIGTLEGIKISVLRRLGAASLKGITVAVQGVGHVGEHLCELLHEEGAGLIVSDIDPRAVQKMVKQYSATGVEHEQIYAVDADVFAPCALGAVINEQTIPQFKFTVVAGAANNQLLDENKHGILLKEKNILYAPDYIINAGGVINCYYELIQEYSRDSVIKKVKNIYQTLETIFQIAEEQNIATHQAAAHFAEKRIETIGNLQRTYLGD
ncbi:MAG: Glu/Leu/Phe/Val dehydrogenase [SAR324 cluster bacterium]|nr:Glu/Leu/Phe/Val dehydrogenase [SAR324 cluster bacterium]